MNHERFYHQDITYWDATSTVDDFGKPVFANPIVVKGHWTDKTQELQGGGGKGATLVSKAMVNLPETAHAHQDDYIFLGISSAPDPTVVVGAFKVIQTADLPDLRNLSTIRVAYL